jgi:hypothetical protein
MIKWGEVKLVQEAIEQVYRSYAEQQQRCERRLESKRRRIFRNSILKSTGLFHARSECPFLEAYIPWSPAPHLVLGDAHVSLQDVLELLDICPQSIVFEHPANIIACLRAISSDWDPVAHWHILSIKTDAAVAPNYCKSKMAEL